MRRECGYTRSVPEAVAAAVVGEGDFDSVDAGTHLLAVGGR